MRSGSEGDTCVMRSGSEGDPSSICVVSPVCLCVSLQCLSPSPLWMNQPVFLPHWNYIPHNAPGQHQDKEQGYVELIGSPVLLCPGPEQGLAAGLGGGAELSRVVGVREAAGLLHNRWVT